MNGVDSYFGPWPNEPQINPWDDYKIGKLSQWYSKSAELFRSCEAQEIEIKSMIGTSQKNQQSQSVRRTREENLEITPKSVSSRKSRIPTIVHESIEQTQENQSTKNSPKKTQSKMNEPEIQHKFVIKSTIIPDSWNDVTSIQSFVSNYALTLQPWPQQNLSFDEAIELTNNIGQSKATEKTKKTKSHVYHY